MNNTDSMARRALTAGLMTIGLLVAGVAHAAPQLLRMTPSGDNVSAATQVVLSFDTDMVELGRMARDAAEVPVTITPALTCQWRWLDTRSLACEIPAESPMQQATRYTVTIAPQLKDLAGEAINGPITRSFVTQRPRVNYPWVRTWRDPRTPVIRASFSQPVTAASVEATAQLGGQVVSVEPDPTSSATPYPMPDGGEARRSWLLLPKSPLPLGREAKLSFRAGLRSAFGDEPGVAHNTSLSVQPFDSASLIGLKCRSADSDDEITIDATDNDPEGDCDPLGYAELVFTSPMVPAQLAKAIRITPDPSGGRKDYDPWANVGASASLSMNNTGAHQYSVYLPFTMKAAAHYKIEMLPQLKDVFGRPLEGPTTVAFDTAHRVPALNLDHTYSVLEQGVDSDVPVVVTNLDQLKLHDVNVTTTDGTRIVDADRPVDKAQDIAFAMPMGIRDLLGGRSGVVRGVLGTDPDIFANDPDDGLHFMAEVSPWQVHVKLGHTDTLVWVTDFATGKPVPGAEVRVYIADPTRWQPVLDSDVRGTATTDADGIATLPGLRDVDPELDHQWNDDKPLAVDVSQGQNMAVVPLISEFSVDIGQASAYDVWGSTRRRFGHLRAWGTTAQGVYRAGDTLQYKLYVRDAADRRMGPAPKGGWTLQIEDPTGKIVQARKGLQLSAFGALDGEFELPAQAAVGWYTFSLESEFDTDDDGDPRIVLSPLRVLVADFTPSPFKLSAEVRAKTVEPGKAVEVALQASLHAGGPFTQAPAQLNLRLSAVPFAPAKGPASSFNFADSASDGDRSPRDVQTLPSVNLRTDAQGQAVTQVSLPATDIAYGRLVAEASVQDDRGRSVAATASAPFAGRDRMIGTHIDGWLLNAGKKATVDAWVVDPSGQPVADAQAFIAVDYEKLTVARVQGAGNAYLPTYTTSWERVETCKLMSETSAPVHCAFTPAQAGSYRVVAMTRDSAGRLYRSSQWLWATGKGEVLWGDGEDTALTLIPDKKTYKVGDTAHLLVKNPYPGATALITTERNGVLSRRTEVLQGSAPVVDIKLDADSLPGVYASVVVQSPRVAKAPIEGGLDLGKPAFRMGYVTLTVDDPAKRLDIAVKPAKDALKPGDEATVDFDVTAREPETPKAEPKELAVAVLDEGVYDLIQGGDAYFDPYTGLVSLDEPDMKNFSLLTRLIGRQKFEKKGANPGGDGGVDLSMRSVDRYVAYWNPSIPVDANGHAEISFKLPDNLTAWKVLALAVTPGDRFGLGSGKITSSLTTELRPLLPQHVIAGDHYRAEFSVMNRAADHRSLKLTLKLDGGQSIDKTVELDSFQRATVGMDVVAPAAPGEQHFEATAVSGDDHDALAATVKVDAIRPDITAADYAALDPGSEPWQVPLKLPDTAQPGSAQASVLFSPSVLGQLDGSFRYVRDYLYLCWEQRLTKAVMAAAYTRLKPWLGDDVNWPEAADLPEQTLKDAAQFQAPDGGMTYWTGRNEHQDPYLSAYTALGFRWLAKAGHPAPQPVVDGLNRYLDGVLRRDISGWSTESMAAIRAVILAARAPDGTLSVSDIERFAPMLPRMGLFGQSMFLQAARQVPGAQAEADTAENLILSRASQSAGQTWLSETEDPQWAWMLGSDLRANCAALMALTVPGASADTAAPNTVDAELPFKLVRAISQRRQGRDYWPNTQENVYCSTALADYAERYESAHPDVSLSAALDGKPVGKAQFASPTDAAVNVSAPVQAVGDHTLTVTHSGDSRGYARASISYAERPEVATAQNAGLAVSRVYEVWRNGAWAALTPGADGQMQVTRGEFVRVTISLQLTSDRAFVAVDDPLPGGLEPVNPDLATAGGLPADAVPQSDAYPWPFLHRELRFSAARFFADRVPRGSYQLHWIGQATVPGQYLIPALHAELMYDPDVFGNDVPLKMQVSDRPDA